MDSSQALSFGADNINPTKPKIGNETKNNFNKITQQPEGSTNGCVDNFVLHTQRQLSPVFD